MKLTADVIRKYVESRFSGQRMGYRREVSLRCPFHDDGTASLSFNVEKGVWKCHAGCGGGGLIDFEQKLNGGSREEAGARIGEVIGADTPVRVAEVEACRHIPVPRRAGPCGVREVAVRAETLCSASSSGQWSLRIQARWCREAAVPPARID